MKRFQVASILLGLSFCHPILAEENSAADGTSEVEDQENSEEEDEISDEELLANDNPWFTDITIALGKRWYDDSSFATRFIQFNTQWSHENLPLAFGPTVTYGDIEPSDTFFEDGNLLQMGLRGSAFYELSFMTPYLAVDYTLYSTGSVEGRSKGSNSESRATLDLKDTGYDLILGFSFVAADTKYFVEGSLSSQRTVESDGEILYTEVSGTTTTVTRTDASGSVSDSSKVIMFGAGLEF